MIVMMDGLPGCRKANIIRYLKEMCPNNIQAMVCQMMETMPCVQTAFTTTDFKVLSHSFITCQFFVISCLLDCMAQLQDKPVEKNHIYVIESSIFWPIVWLETLADIQLITEIEKQSLVQILNVVVARWGEFLKQKNYKLVHMMIHREANIPYELMGETHTFQLQPLIWDLHPNFWERMNSHISKVYTFINLHAGVSFPEKNFQWYSFTDHMMPGTCYSVEDMGDMIMTKLEDILGEKIPKNLNTIINMAFND